MVDEFIVFLFFVVTHAAARINPIAINKVSGTIRFIESSVARSLILIE